FLDHNPAEFGDVALGRGRVIDPIDDRVGLWQVPIVGQSLYQRGGGAIPIDICREVVKRLAGNIVTAAEISKHMPPAAGSVTFTGSIAPKRDAAGATDQGNADPIW